MTPHTHRFLIAFLLLGLGACTGLITDPGGSPGGETPTTPRIPTDPEDCADTIILGTAPMRRLSNVEYQNTLSHLFGGDLPELPAFPGDGVAEGKFENDARALGPDDVRIARYEEAAFRAAEAVASDPTRLAAFVPCASYGSDAEARECGALFVSDFGKRALRRPLTADEATRYEAFFEAQRAAIDFEAAVQLTTMAFLQAPQFIYRLELNDATRIDDARVSLDQYELASRLSYFFWESMPDDALMAAADAGELSNEAAYESHVRRLMADPRAHGTVANFHRQWLHFDRVLDESRDPSLFPEWGDSMREAVRAESVSFVDNVFFGEDPTLSALLLSREVELTPELAGLYGVDEGTTTLPENERAGILTRAAFLAGNAHAANGSPPLRGVHLMERYLCEPRPSPPPDADVTPPEQMEGDEAMTNRMLFERRTASPACRSCHDRIDGFGFAFENYDAIGAFRTEDNGLPVDASGNVTGTGETDGPFVGAVELSEALAESRTVEECVTTQWFRFGNGRLEEPEDQCQIWRLTDLLHESGGNLQELLVQMALAPEFRQRRIVQ